MNRSIIIILVTFFLSFNVYAVENNYFELGKKNFDLNKLDKSKLYFEKDIVRNPKN